MRDLEVLQWRALCHHRALVGSQWSRSQSGAPKRLSFPTCVALGMFLKFWLLVFFPLMRLNEILKTTWVNTQTLRTAILLVIRINIQVQRPLTYYGLSRSHLLSNRSNYKCKPSQDKYQSHTLTVSFPPWITNQIYFFELHLPLGGAMKIS